MHFEGEFRVPGRSDDVIRRFADVPRMAGCMPGARLEPQAEDGSYPGAMVVAFGPKESFFANFVRLLGEPPRSADICFLTPIAAGELEGRSRIADLARERIVAAMDSDA